MSTIPNPVGRPPLSNPTQLGFRMSPEALAMADRGSLVLHHARDTAVSRSAWIRELIRYVGIQPVSDWVSLDKLQEHWEDLQPSKDTQIKITASLEEQHRIWLRQFECHAQSLDWSLRLGQNEALLLLICLHGEACIQSLRQKSN